MILTKNGITRYFLHDYESGVPYEVSKEYYEWYNTTMKANWEAAMPKIGNYPGTIIIFGTGGDMERGQDFQELFYNPDNYNLKTFDDKWQENSNNQNP